MTKRSPDVPSIKPLNIFEPYVHPLVEKLLALDANWHERIESVSGLGYDMVEVRMTDDGAIAVVPVEMLKIDVGSG